MTATTFPEANAVFTAPSDMHEEQVQPIHAYQGVVVGGSCDGCGLTVTAWTPTPAELAELNQGKPLFLSFLGGLPPHFVCVDFHSATNPA